jgi:hypothetical protein
MPDVITYTPENKIPLLEDALQGALTWKPTREDGEVITRVLYRFEHEMLPASQAFWQEWDDAKKIYEAWIQPDPLRLRETFKVPWSHTIIEAASAEEVDAFPDFAIDTQEGEDKQKLPILNAAKKYALQRANWEKVKHEALRLRRIYGWCAVRLSYSRETRIIKQRKPMKGDNGLMLGYEEVVDYPWDDLRFEVIDNPRRFIIDDNAKELDDSSGRGADDCALITDMSWLAFREMCQHDIRFKNVKFVKPGAEYWVNDNMEVVCPEQIPADTSKKVRVIEYWNKRTDEYVVIANGVLIRYCPLVDDHKELPFACLHMHRRPHTFYSKGIPKLIESLEAVYNAVMQAEVRATKLAFPILRMDEDSATDPRSVAPYPGVVLEASKDSVELLQLGTVPGEVYKLKDKIESLLVWVTGVNYQQMFSANESDRVGIEALKKETQLARVNLSLRENEANFVVRIGQMLVQDIMQYYPVPKVRRLLPADDITKLSKMKMSWAGTSMPKLIKGKDGRPEGVWELRKIPVEGMVIKEQANEDKGLFTLTNEGSGGNSYILARPEYIRTTSRLDIRAIRPSAMGSSKEAKKLTMLELSAHALQVNQMNMTTNDQGMPVPTPIWDIEYLEKMVAEAYELPTKKAILSEGEGDGNSAQKALEDVAGKFNQAFKDKTQFAGQPAPASPLQPNAQQAQSMVQQSV